MTLAEPTLGHSWQTLLPFSHTEKPVSVELSCGAGPSHVVLEPGLPLLLDCNLGASETPFNVTWLQDGQTLPPEGDHLQYLANGSLLLLPTSRDGRPAQRLEGGYSCVSAGAAGALTSRTVNVLLAGRCPATPRAHWFIWAALFSTTLITHAVEGLPMLHGRELDE